MRSSALFEYRLRESVRARSVRLRVSVEDGLEVIVPRGYDTTHVPRLLERMEPWIREALAKAEKQRGLVVPEPPWEVPTEILLPAVDQRFEVFAKPSRSAQVGVRELNSGGLSVHGAVDNEVACRAALTRWLARKAHEHLVQQLESLAADLGFEFRLTYIRRQRTRWGSCSSRKTITLNAKLLFLTPALVQSVMIHELCHLREMNHSKRFWRLVQHYDPDFRSHDRQLRDAWKSVPRWAN